MKIKCPQCQTYFVPVKNPTTGKLYWLCRCEKKTENKCVVEEVQPKIAATFAEGL